MNEPWKMVGLTDDEYSRIKEELGREPNNVELSLYGVMWSEHCGYKYSRPLFKHFPTTGKRVLQGPGENAGIVDIDDNQVITMKVESHNHPSAIAPYQGAATGVGGIIRDILAMGAYPIALLNSLHFGNIAEQPKTKYFLNEIVRGIADYGNCVGIPTVGGEVKFSERYQGNPLVNAMCVGIMDKADIQTATAAGPGNSIMVVGNLTGKDGIGGASFASKELDEEKEKEDRSSIQVGDPFMEKLLIEACLEAFKQDYIIGVQDMGAAGIISSTSETASKAGNGIEIDVSLVPKREKGMRPEEVMISESQERMLLIVKKGKEDEVNKLFHKWDLHAVVIGRVTDDGMIRVLDNDKQVGEVPAASLTEAPKYRLESKKPDYLEKTQDFDIDSFPEPDDYNEAFKKLISSPNIASKKWFYRQYDHMIQLNSVTWPGNNSAVLRIKDKDKAIAVTLDSNARYVYLNPEKGSEITICEAARNLISSGALPIAVTDGLNFGNPEKPEIYYQFEKSIIGLSNACRKLDTPVISGNVSFYNETPLDAVYPTPIIGMLGLIKSLKHITTNDFKNVGNIIIVIGETKEEINGSEYLKEIHNSVCGDVPEINLDTEVKIQKTVLDLIQNGYINSAQDIGDGGIACTLAECAVNGNLGCSVELDSTIRKDALLFGETQSRFIVTVSPKNEEKLNDMLIKNNIPYKRIGKVIEDNFVIKINDENIISVNVDEIKDIYYSAFEKELNT